MKPRFEISIIVNDLYAADTRIDVGTSWSLRDATDSARRAMRMAVDASRRASPIGIATVVVEGHIVDNRYKREIIIHDI